MVRSSMLAAALLALPACGVRAPAPLDVTALVRTQGAAGARATLEVRTLDAPRDVAARLALARLADEAGRPSQALAQLEAVIALGGPIGTRWHGDDRARFARLLVARGRARLAREAPTARADLERARSFGATVTDDELRRAARAVALAHLRHVDAEERERGRRMLVALIGTPGADPSWLGARPDPVPRDRGLYGAWLWAHGARRAAWEALESWRTTTAERDSPIAPVHAEAAAWWHPPEGPTAPRATAGRASPAPAAAVAVPATTARGPYEAALVAYVAARAPGVPAASIAGVVDGYRRDPGVADRLGDDLVAEATDAAEARAALGALFDVIGDPARARAAWEAAVAGSPEPGYVRGLALAIARAGDPDAALIHATTAAAASGDPAAAWIEVARALDEVREHVHALEAARYAIDLAGRDLIVEALDAAIAPSEALGRAAQVDQLRGRRARLAGDPGGAGADALAAYLDAPSATTLAGLWVASRGRPADVRQRAALVGALAGHDPRRRAIVEELVALAAAADPALGRAAVIALRER